MRSITRGQAIKHHEEKLENNLPMSKMKKVCKKGTGMSTNTLMVFFWKKHKRKKTSIVKKNQKTKANCQKKHKNTKP
jgi:hypothetical protein